MIKIGIIRETKTPIDNRVVFTPAKIIQINQLYPQLKFFVQSSKDRIYKDDEYRSLGINVVDDVSECDYLFGVKEATVDSLISDKHYFFFGHITKGQDYNKPLLNAMQEKRITFTDYEYMCNEKGERLCAFGWWAGVVGAYNTIRLCGIKYKLFDIHQPDALFTIEKMKENLLLISREFSDAKKKILISGNGLVAEGARFVLDYMKVPEVDVNFFLTNSECDFTSYCIAKPSDLLARYSSGLYTRADLRANPASYYSLFRIFARETDVLISCHYWDEKAPKYFTKDIAMSDENRIKVIGDVTCDINGSIETTIRPSTHQNPFYALNANMEEVACLSDADHIAVMAVDTLPNALAKNASEDFGCQILKSDLLKSIALKADYDMIDRATILRSGKTTSGFVLEL